MKKNITTEIIVKENKIGIMRVGNVNYISLTDLARYKDKKKNGLYNSKLDENNKYNSFFRNLGIFK